MVRELYAELGFQPVDEAEPGTSRWALDLPGYLPKAVPMQVDSVSEVVA